MLASTCKFGKLFINSHKSYLLSLNLLGKTIGTNTPKNVANATDMINGCCIYKINGGVSTLSMIEDIFQ